MDFTAEVLTDFDRYLCYYFDTAITKYRQNRVKVYRKCFAVCDTDAVSSRMEQNSRYQNNHIYIC